ncbi:MAG: HEPN domain-containing protein [Sulfuritalea sp.]|nr:HEPN domain-containing protein [Sulfuritalea sp.]
MKLMAKRKEDALAMIPHPSGRGHLICGREASQRLSRVTSLVFEYAPDLSDRIDPAKTRKKVVDAFVLRVLTEKRDLDCATVEAILEDVSAQCRESLAASQHFLPCVLFRNGRPDEFSVGPVTFSRRASFFRSRRQWFKDSVEASARSHVAYVDRAVKDGFPRERAATKDDSRHLVRDLHASAVKTFRNYPWVATVSVANCDHKTGAEIAERAVALAINSIRVILGASYTDGLRLAWFPINPRRTAKMWADSKGCVHVSISSNADGPVGIENWYDGLTVSNGAELAICGSALNALVACAPVIHLQQRFLDAINWYGDAAADPEPTARIVKYVSAIERLLFGARQRETTKQFASRLRALWVGFACYEKDIVAVKADKVYRARSGLLHGSMSPRSKEIRGLVRQSEELARLCILCAGRLYPMMIKAYGDPGPERLENVMMQIQSDGLDWLAREAGYEVTSGGGDE